MKDEVSLDEELFQLQPGIQQGDVPSIQRALRVSDRRISSLIDSQIEDGVKRAFRSEIAELIQVLEKTLTVEEKEKVKGAIASLRGM